MRSLLLTLLLPTVFLGACTCGPRQPVKDTLKKLEEPCVTDDSCESGLCDAAPGFASVCVKKCSDGCSAEEVCTQLTAGRFSCQLDRRGLCQACLIDADCPYPADKCLVVNGERVCGRDCAFDQNCPRGYLCVNGRGPDGLTKPQQCSPAVASCACLARGDLMQPCEVTNAFGTCRGLKTCDLVGNAVACNAKAPSEDLCNGLDDDCDGQVDEASQPLSCGVGACRRTVSSCVDGGPAACTPGDAGVELCNNVDDNCDGVVDDGFPVDSDVDNCGGCGVRCMLANATPTCVARQCRVGTCNFGFGNCDGLDPNGCEVNTQTDPLNCSACGLACSRPGSVASCVAGQCRYACAPNTYDLNNDPTDGCEYSCTFMSAIDLPDLGFVDANCDGIDGEVNNGIFVSPAGNDSNPGSLSQPKATLAAAMTSVVTAGKRDVYLAAGTHPGPLALLGVSGINVAGAYHPTTWRRALTNQVRVVGGAKALEIEGASNVLVQAIRFEGGVGTPSAYGGWVKESQGVRLESLELRAGAGADGAAGADGTTGAVGQPGTAGGAGCANDRNLTAAGIGCAIVLGLCSRPAAGQGGASSCGYAGGNGGSPAYATGSGPGTVGSAAPNGSGAGGVGVAVATSRGGAAPNASNGGDGQPGNPGADGPGANNPGTFSSTGFSVVAGSNGLSAGSPGRGGGGGGGGCGDQFNFLSYTCQSFGSGGGGGGGGGCGGTLGQGGQGGGASVGLFLFNASVTAQGVVVVSGNGGRGGAGGQGGSGGTGGARGGSPYGGNSQGNACVGGLGGVGGAGGRGGHGGGGSGGSVYGLVKNTASTWNPVSGTSFMVGTPGAAGTSPGAGGVMGTTGIQVTF